MDKKNNVIFVSVNGFINTDAHLCLCPGKLLSSVHRGHGRLCGCLRVWHQECGKINIHSHPHQFLTKSVSPHLYTFTESTCMQHHRSRILDFYFVMQRFGCYFVLKMEHEYTVMVGISLFVCALISFPVSVVKAFLVRGTYRTDSMALYVYKGVK